MLWLCVQVPFCLDHALPNDSTGKTAASLWAHALVATTPLVLANFFAYKLLASGGSASRSELP